MKRLLVAALSALFLSASGATCAQPLGRLFYSDDERALLEQKRTLPVAEAVPSTVGAIRHDGLVTRSQGRPVWFVNGRATEAGALSRLPARARGSVLELPGSDGRAVRLRPGEQATVDESGQATPSGPTMDIRPGRTR